MLAKKPLSPELRQQVIDDTLSGSAAAKRACTERGMTLDITGGAAKIDVPTVVVVGEADRVEHEAVLRRELVSRLHRAEIVTLSGIGHLSRLEAPELLAAAISKTLRRSAAKRDPFTTFHKVCFPRFG